MKAFISISELQTYNIIQGIDEPFNIDVNLHRKNIYNTRTNAKQKSSKFSLRFFALWVFFGVYIYQMVWQKHVHDYVYLCVLHIQHIVGNHIGDFVNFRSKVQKILNG